MNTAPQVEAVAATGDWQEAGYFPNKLGHILLLALEEVLGQNSLRAVLTLARLPELAEHKPPVNFELAFPFSALVQLTAAMDEIYGPRSGQQHALLAGRAAFRHGIKDFGGLLSVADVAFRVLPLSFRVRLGTEVLAEILNRYSDQRVRLAENAEAYLWIMERCGICWGRQTTYPCCSLAVGLVQEALYWASGGRLVVVEEVTCAARGDPACMLRIGRIPVE